jgi:hypothetical protein
MVLISWAVELSIATIWVIMKAVTRRHKFGERFGVTQGRAVPLETQCQNFLLDVVNGADRSSSMNDRRHFARVYANWFPPQDNADLAFQRAYYNDVRNWWREHSEQIPAEGPDEHFGYHVITLRHKLRTIWGLADSGSLMQAESYVYRILVWLRRCYSQPCDARNEGWRDRLSVAVTRLIPKIARLRICKNPECKNPYFFKESQIRFCSTECAWNAERLRHQERAKLKLPKTRLTPAGKRKISLAQQKRWQRYRDLKKVRPEGKKGQKMPDRTNSW